MTIERLLIVGAGGHGKVVIDALRSSKTSMQIDVADDNINKNRQVISGHSITAPIMNALSGSTVAYHVSVGNNASRARISEELKRTGLINMTIWHDRACISENARILRGVFIAANAVIAPDALLEDGCIINHGAIVDHDCIVGEFTHIAPNATLGGGVTIGKRVLIGAGANILPGVFIGDDCVVGAGAVVLNDLDAGNVSFGVPARIKISEKASD